MSEFARKDPSGFKVLVHPEFGDSGQIFRLRLQSPLLRPQGDSITPTIMSVIHISIDLALQMADYINAVARTTCTWKFAAVATAVLLNAPAVCTAQVVPSYSGPTLDPLLPYGGVPLAGNVSLINVYRAVESVGTVSMSPVLDFHADQFMVSWIMKDSPNSSAGQSILYSQSMDGETWSPSDGTNVLFPPLSLSANFTVDIYSAPALHINGSDYAVCGIWGPVTLYPVLNMDWLLIRKLNPGLNNLGPIFWATNTALNGFENVSAFYGFLTLNQMDAQTQADINTLYNTSTLPCDPTTAGCLQCPACLGGCQNTSTVANITLGWVH
jgi:hypothetical protein